MLNDQIPTTEDVHAISNCWARRSNVPIHVFKAIDALPQSTHPMTQFVVGITALQTESLFAKAYKEGVSKKEYWDATYEDSMNLIAKLPRLASYIYRRKYRGGEHIEPNPNLDWAANFAHMLGFDSDDNEVTLITEKEKYLIERQNKRKVSKKIIDFISGRINDQNN